MNNNLGLLLILVCMIFLFSCESIETPADGQVLSGAYSEPWQSGW